MHKGKLRLRFGIGDGMGDGGIYGRGGEGERRREGSGVLKGVGV